MKEENKEIYEGSREYLLSIGYEAHKQCEPYLVIGASFGT